MAQDIYIIDNTNKLITELKDLFKKEKDYKFKSVKTNDLDIALKDIPALIIIDEETTDEDAVTLCKKIRNNEDNSITPIIVASTIEDREHRLNVMKEGIEYYIKKPVDKEYMYYTIKNLLTLIYTNRRVSPLTGLPGNVQIQAELKRRLLRKTEFAVLYLDLDNFKAYNDVYGFLKGDEIIKFTANTIVRNVHSTDTTDNFVGHIGGDDFVAIVDHDCYEKICQQIIAEFDTGVLNYFTEADQEKGYLEVPNRRGVVEQFPLTSISIGAVVVDKMRYANILQIGEVGAQVKHIAKTTPGSTYIINRRRNKE